MSYLYKKSEGTIKNSVLVLWGYATVFFPRLLASLGAPSPINFAHFLVIPVIAGMVTLKARIRDQRQIAIATELSIALGLLMVCMLTSATFNQTGLVNVFISYMLLAEPFIFLLAIVLNGSDEGNLKKIRNTILAFALINLILAIAQSVLIPAGIYPKPQGGTIQDNIAGVFGGGGGSAGNYVSCTVSIYFGVYFLNRVKTAPAWMRIGAVAAALYQTQVSDSKQVFLALAAGLVFLVLAKYKQVQKLFIYAIVTILLLGCAYWAIQNLDFGFLGPYRNWLNREGIYGPDGEATRTKLAAFRIIPTYFESPVNWLLGLGPGHGVSRLGGWILRDYARLLFPLGATFSPASSEVFQVVQDGWIAQESTVYFPLFTWAGIWSDFGVVGLASYLYLCSVVWKWLCVDDYCRFLMLSTAAFGFILTQMEEPGQVLTVAMLIGLRWQESQLQRQRSRPPATLPLPSPSNLH